MYTKHFTIIFVCICAIHTAASSESCKTLCYFWYSIVFFNHLAARCRRQTGGAGTCILTPQATEGPYYWNATIRQNITYALTIIFNYKHSFFFFLFIEIGTENQAFLFVLRFKLSIRTTVQHLLMF